MTEIDDFREGKDRYFEGGQESPLTQEQQDRFLGLEHFLENPRLQFVLTVSEFPEDDKEAIQMATGAGETASHRRWGQLKFEVGGTPVVLTVYRGEDADVLFLPFTDATTGDESYADGCYLDLPATGDGHLVDFNYAYNPYCAYNPPLELPDSPVENRLSVAIDAGEKTFPDARCH